MKTAWTLKSEASAELRIGDQYGQVGTTGRVVRQVRIVSIEPDGSVMVVALNGPIKGAQYTVDPSVLAGVRKSARTYVGDDWEPVTQDEVGDLLERAEEALGGFNKAWDTCPEFRALTGAARKSLGQRKAYDALLDLLDGRQ